MNERVPLVDVLRALHGAVVELVVPPTTTDVGIGSVALLDENDLVSAHTTADLCLIVGATASTITGWLDELALRGPDDRPLAIMIKASSTAVQHAARTAGVAVVAVHAQARWERVLSMVRGVLGHSVQRVEPDPVGDGTSLDGTSLYGTSLYDTDLYGLAQTIASLTKGMVSIEDERSHVLAYSAADDAADELRTLSILGREGPADYLRRLRDQGVFDRIRRSDDVVDVPADDGLGIRRRLVVGIRSIPDPAGAVVTLGSIWIQEGQQPISGDADAVLRGGAAVAARLIKRILDAPTNETLQIQRLLGARGGGVDVPSLAAALSISVGGPAAVIGFASVGAGSIGEGSIGELAASIRLHASAFHRSSLATAMSGRVYVLFPGEIASRSLESWAREVITRIDKRTGTALRAALVAVVESLADVAAARYEVDRVLDRTSGGNLVTTLEESRTSVLLGEIVELVAHHEHLLDPRIQTLKAYDEKNNSTMTASLAEYLACFGDVRAAAATLQVHPNTLRYRMRRIEEILGADLNDPDDRILIELQLRVSGR